MRRTRRNPKRYVESSDSENEVPTKRVSVSPIIENKQEKPSKLSEDSSSESDIENYLQPVDKLDLNSDFFKIHKPVNEFSKIEENIFSGITRLSESDSDIENEEEQHMKTLSKKKKKQVPFKDAEPSTSYTSSKSTFHELHEYTRKIEEAKKYVEQYKAKKLAEEENEDVLNLLQAGELKTGLEHTITASDLHSSDFESCDSEQEGWEEIKTKDEKDKQQKTLVPKHGLQITVDMPGGIKKKKGVDLLAAMKRRLNRRRKENQVLVHKVHVLCWIAHGHFVNSVINDTCTLAMALSLLPSEKCYPPDRTDLGYLEQIVNWFKRTVKNINKPSQKDVDLLSSLQQQISKREAYNKKMLVYIFIAILRSLGIQCRLVLSFQVEPLRPPTNELHSLSNQEGTKSEKKKVSSAKGHLKSNTSISDNPSKKLSKSGNTKQQQQNKPEGPSILEVTKDKHKSDPKSQKSKIVSGTKSETAEPRKVEKRIEKKSETKSVKTLETDKTEEAGSSKQNRSTSERLEKKDGKCEGKELKSKNRKQNNEKVNLRSLRNSKQRSLPQKSNSKNKVHLVSDVQNLKFNVEKIDGIDSKQASKSNKQTNDPPQKRNKRISTEHDHSEMSSKDQQDDMLSLKVNIEKLDCEHPKKASESHNRKDEPPTKRDTRIRTENSLAEKSSKDKQDDKFSLKANVGNLDVKNVEGTVRSTKQENLPHSKVDDSAVPKRNKRTKSPELEPSKSSDVRRTRSTSSIYKQNKKIIKMKLPPVTKRINVQQVDGTADSSSDDEWEDIPQFDGADDKHPNKSNKKPNLSKLKSSEESVCPVKKHPKRLKANENKNDSENEFEASPRVSFVQKNDAPVKKDLKVSLQKLRPELPSERAKPSLAFPPSQKKQLDVRGDIMNLIKGRIKEQKHIEKSRMVKKRRVDPYSDSDSDYAPEPIKKKHHDSGDEFVPQTKVKRRVRVPGKSVLSDSDGESSDKKMKKGIDVWAEVFLESEEKWISVDVIFGEIHCVEKLYNRATHPVAYLVAWNNNGSLKDVTKRYCHNFNTITRKQRVDAKWWDETLKPFLGKKTARDKEEDDDLARQQLDQPLPKSISEYKNHPLYALKRHLLKFEAIYPADAPTVGFVRGEAVYPRECIYTCMSRDIWVKQARVVKPGEKPYKIVKARPKYDKLSNQIITDQLLEIFGPWQTEDYVPPTAENGVVPRNAFGNVEMFKPCMLPKGTVHLKLPGLNKVAKRMNIDCAPAIVGFDFHGGWSHPTYDGFIVCKEYEDILIAAWDLEQDEIEKREQEKIDKRVYGNWKKLIKGLLIREKLKARYDFGESSSQGGKEKKKAKGPRFCTKKRRVYSSNSESD